MRCQRQAQTYTCKLGAAACNYAARHARKRGKCPHTPQYHCAAYCRNMPRPKGKFSKAGIQQRPTQHPTHHSEALCWVPLQQLCHQVTCVCTDVVPCWRVRPAEGRAQDAAINAQLIVTQPREGRATCSRNGQGGHSTCNVRERTLQLRVDGGEWHATLCRQPSGQKYMQLAPQAVCSTERSIHDLQPPLQHAACGLRNSQVQNEDKEQTTVQTPSHLHSGGIPALPVHRSAGNDNQ